MPSNTPRRAAFQCIALILVGVLAACGGSAAAAPGSLLVQADTIGDSVTVRILGGSEWADTGVLVPEVAIGAADGPDEYLLGNIRSLAISAAGEIYAMDGQVPALRKYSAQGDYLMTLGREGSGPGEYRRPDGGLAVLSGGRVVLRDPGNSRMAVYDSGGNYLEQWSGVRSGFNTSRKMFRTDEDAVHTLVILETDLPPWQWTYGFARFNPDGTMGDTAVVPKWDYERAMIRGEREGNSSMNGVPFAPGDHWTLLPNGHSAGGLANEYAFTIFRGDSVTRVIRESWDPVPVLSEEADERERSATHNMRQNFPGWTWNGPPIPTLKPAYTNLLSGDDGRIWAQVPTLGTAFMTEAEAAAEEERQERPVHRYRESVAFDVFSGSGDFLGHVKAPTGFSLYPTPVFRGDTVWAVAEDPDLGIPQIVRYTIQR